MVECTERNVGICVCVCVKIFSIHLCTSIYGENGWNVSDFLKEKYAGFFAIYAQYLQFFAEGKILHLFFSIYKKLSI